MQKMDHNNSLLNGSTLDAIFHLQRIQNYAARLILPIVKSSKITTDLNCLHWFSKKQEAQNCLCQHGQNSTQSSCVTDMPQKKPSYFRNTRSSSHTMPLLNKPAHSYIISVISYCLLPLLSGTLAKVISGVFQHVHHLNLA